MTRLKGFKRGRNCSQYIYTIASIEFFLARGYIEADICHIIVNKYSSTSCQLHFAIFEVRNDYFYFDTYLTPGFLYLDLFSTFEVHSKLESTRLYSVLRFIAYYVVTQTSISNSYLFKIQQYSIQLMILIYGKKFDGYIIVFKSMQ